MSALIATPSLLLSTFKKGPGKARLLAAPEPDRKTMLKPTFKAAAAAAFFLLIILHAKIVCAGSFQVNPIRVDMSARVTTAALTIRNDGDEPVVIQLSVLAWSQESRRGQVRRNERGPGHATDCDHCRGCAANRPCRPQASARSTTGTCLSTFPAGSAAAAETGLQRPAGRASCKPARFRRSAGTVDPAT